MRSKFGDQLPKFYFLTLADEKSNDKEWINISYRQLLDELSKISNSSDNDFHDRIFLEYILTLGNIVSTSEDFLLNPCEYENVFNDGSKKKAHKIRTPIYSRKELISTNQLETIFQKLYFRKVLNEIGHDIDHFINETRGNAILGILISPQFSDTVNSKIRALTVFFATSPEVLNLLRNYVV